MFMKFLKFRKIFLLSAINLLLIVLFLFIYNKTDESYNRYVRCYFHYCEEPRVIVSALEPYTETDDLQIRYIMGQIYALGFLGKRDRAKATYYFKCPEGSSDCVDGDMEYFTALRLLRGDYPVHDFLIFAPDNLASNKLSEDERKVDIMDGVFWMKRAALDKGNRHAIAWLEKCKRYRECK